MEQKLISNNPLKRGFTLIEVIVSLLIISITFITFSGLLDQNIKSQDIKRHRGGRGCQQQRSDRQNVQNPTMV